MAMFLFYLGLTLFVVGYAWLLVEAFKASIIWGIASLVPPLALVFGIWHIRQQWLPTFVMVTGVFVLLILMPLMG